MNKKLSFINPKKEKPYYFGSIGGLLWENMPQIHNLLKNMPQKSQKRVFFFFLIEYVIFRKTIFAFKKWKTFSILGLFPP